MQVCVQTVLDADEQPCGRQEMKLMSPPKAREAAIEFVQATEAIHLQAWSFGAPHCLVSVETALLSS